MVAKRFRNRRIPNQQLRANKFDPDRFWADRWRADGIEMTKFQIITLGCKVNQCESEALDRQLQVKGGQRISPNESADLTIINTCAVTGKAAMQSRQAIRRAIRENSDTRIVVTGCYARTDPEAVRQTGDGNHVVACLAKELLPNILDSSFSLASVPADSTPIFSPLSVGVAAGRTRPFLKIQDGCNAQCTYCIVPLARGRSRSMPMNIVLDNLRELHAAGYHETVLTGIHLGAYGRDLSPPASLSDLLDAIQKQPSPSRIRLSSIEPRELTDVVIGQMAENDLFCRHFHIPLQSGDDDILKRMQRPYTAAYFDRLSQKIISSMPDAAIGADVLVGFPGETEKAFENTVALIEALPITYLHVFPFSARPGTPAANFADPLSPETIKTRCRRLRVLGGEKKNRFFRRHIGQTMRVLVENKRDHATGRLKGLSSNYIHVLIDGDDDLKNRLVQVEITQVDESNRVIGQVIGSVVKATSF